MGGFNTNEVSTSSFSSTQSYSAYNEERAALPGFHLINLGVEQLKQWINNGEGGCSCSKAVAYLGFRLVSYLCIPLALNIISALVSLVFCILMLPIAICNPAPLQWCWARLKGSVGYVGESLFDLTCDVRLLIIGAICCPSSSAPWLNRV